MAKIDTSNIEGFENMTAEEKLNALLGMDVPDRVDMSQFVPKSIADKYASEAADMKKQLRSKMSDDEAAKAQADADRHELEEKYNALLKKTTVAEYKAKYIAQGYDEKMAEETANALVDGDVERVFANGEKFKAELEKRIKADVLKGTPRPGVSDNGSELLTRTQIMQIKDPVERQNAIAENMNLFGKE